MSESQVQNEQSEKKMSYKIGEFEGPLDLLWALIHEKKIDVYDIPIIEITEQFLEYLDFAVSVDLGDLSDFYAMAAKLIYIKSRMMLPVDSSVDEGLDFDDPRDELVERLIEYQKFKKLSSLMEEKEDLNEWNFERKKIHRAVPEESREDIWEKVDTWNLLDQMQKMFRNLISSFNDARVLDMNEEISVNEKKTLMAEFLEQRGECFFSDLIVRAGSKLDVICAFMAVLEAVKEKLAEIYQNKLFGDIKICRYRAA
ncbi:MAG: segregation/condensation protein A [Treponema sp.]|nr:segregation/condensation protein A [Treponema sp.]